MKDLLYFIYFASIGTIMILLSLIISIIVFAFYPIWYISQKIK